MIGAGLWFSKYAYIRIRFRSPYLPKNSKHFSTRASFTNWQKALQIWNLGYFPLMNKESNHIYNSEGNRILQWFLLFVFEKLGVSVRWWPSQILPSVIWIFFKSFQFASHILVGSFGRPIQHLVAFGSFRWLQLRQRNFFSSLPHYYTLPKEGIQTYGFTRRTLG